MKSDPNKCPKCGDYMRDCICEEFAKCFYCGADIDPTLALCDECTESHNEKELTK